jgi:hypothetical protein
MTKKIDKGAKTQLQRINCGVLNTYYYIFYEDLEEAQKLQIQRNNERKMIITLIWPLHTVCMC